MGLKKDDENAQGVRYDAKERMTQSGRSEWYFEERTGSIEANGMLLVRIMIAKIAKRERLVDILRGVPVRQDEPGWNCVGWVKEALENLCANGEVLGTSRVVWQNIRDAAMWYVEKKKREHRFDGQGNFNRKMVATYDTIEQKEIVP